MLPIDGILNLGGKLIDRFIPDPEAKARAEMELLEMAQRGELKEFELEVKDRDSARKREMEVKDSTPRVLAYITILGYFMVLGYMLKFGLPENGGDALMIMLGTLGSAVTGALGYYFGSSSGSKSKTYHLSKKGL